jgi:hypothetical protein
MVNRLGLGQGVHACRYLSDLVFLSLPLDEYFIVEGDDAARIWRGLKGELTASDFLDLYNNSVFNKMIRSGLLIPSAPSEYCSHLASSNVRQSQTFSVGECPGLLPNEPAIISLSTLTEMAYCVAWAKLARSFLSLQNIVKLVERQRPENQNPKIWTANEYSTLLDQFARNQVFYYGRSNNCILNSLVLIKFLAENGIYPKWIFGVRTKPFAAHCWLEGNEILFDDQLVNTCGFEKILIV